MQSTESVRNAVLSWSGMAFKDCCQRVCGGYAGGAGCDGTAEGLARSKGGVLQRHRCLRAPQPGVHGPSRPVGGWHPLFLQLPGNIFIYLLFIICLLLFFNYLISAYFPLLDTQFFAQFNVT